MTATVTRITRDEAQAQARERLPEILAEVVPGFRPDKAFRCLSPDHEDRHPSARYMSRTNTVRCFACGWTGDVFKVVGTVYGLVGSDMFRKTYDLLGIDARGSGARRPQPIKRRPLGAPPENWQEIADLIYPPGWDVVEEVDEIKLPLPLRVSDQVEAGIIGHLLQHPSDVLIAFRVGLRQRHFEDAAFGELYHKLVMLDELNEYADDFLTWVKALAIPAHMLRRSARFITATGRRRLLDMVLTKAFTYHQNGDLSRWLLAGILRRAAAITREKYKIPEVGDQRLGELAADLFERFHAGELPDAILAQFKKRENKVAA